MTEDLARVIIEIRRELGVPDFEYGDIVRSSHVTIFPGTAIVKAKFISYSLEIPSIVLVQMLDSINGISLGELPRQHWIIDIQNKLSIKLDTSGYYLWVQENFLSLDYEEELPTDISS